MNRASWVQYSWVLAVVGLLFSSCIHKTLCYEDGERAVGEVEIVFDWKNAPKANPSEMNLFLFPENGGERILHQFTNKTGGKRDIPVGRYKVIAFNNTDDKKENIAGDNLSAIKTRGVNAFDTFEAFLQEEDPRLLSYAAASRAVRGSAEPVIRPGRQLWSASDQTIEIVNSETPQRIVLYPEQRHITYTVIVEKVENPYVATGDGVRFEASISTMLTGWYLGKVKPSTSPLSTIAFPLLKENDGLNATIITLGEDPSKGKEQEHTLTIYYTVPNGEKLYEEFKFKNSSPNVDASDPYNIVIKIAKLTLPNPLVIGATPIVINQWKEGNNITVTM